MNKILNNLKNNKLGWGVFGLTCLAAWIVRALVLAVFPLSPVGGILAILILVPGALVAWLVSKAANKVKLMQAQKMEKEFAENERRQADSEKNSWENRLRVAQLSSELGEPIPEQDEFTQPEVKHLKGN